MKTREDETLSYGEDSLLIDRVWATPFLVVDRVSRSNRSIYILSDESGENAVPVEGSELAKFAKHILSLESEE